MTTVCNPTTIPLSSFIFKTRVKNHSLIKQTIIDSIESMGTYSYSQPGNQQISNTDWHLNPDTPRPYINYLNHIFDDHNKQVMDVYGFDLCNRLDVWFQQYHKGDYHIWHTHRGSMFSNVYYVALNSDCPKTSFMIENKETEFDVAEGDIITFPSYIKHRSKPNTCDSIKTIVSFNTDFC